MNIRSIFAVASVTSAIGLFATSTFGQIDLTTEGASSNHFGAVYQQTSEAPGTGVFGTFVQIQDRGEEEGYNTSGRPEPFDIKNSLQHNHDLQLGQLSLTTVGSSNYYVFKLDINEQGNDASLLSLDSLKIFTSPTGSQNTEDLNALGTLRYDLDGNGDTFIALDSALGTKGSGDADMLAFIPESAFAGVGLLEFVYLYSHFGAEGGLYVSHSGFEEWAAGQGEIIPEPSTALLVAMSLLSFVGLARSRR